MIRLRATLVATTRMSPWRTGWALERGVDFRVSPGLDRPDRTAMARDGSAGSERACFIDEEEPRLPAPAAAAASAGVAPGEASGTDRVWAWWSLGAKASRT
ncbi:MAG: hypothetical protein ACK4VY_08590 [Brevundimonas sp.]